LIVRSHSANTMTDSTPLAGYLAVEFDDDEGDPEPLRREWAIA